MSSVKNCPTVRAVGGQFCLATSESYFSVLRSLSSWCTNIQALRIYRQTMGTKVCIFETWIAAAVSGFISCKQALFGALAAGRKMEGELVTTSLEFEYLHGKS